MISSIATSEKRQGNLENGWTSPVHIELRHGSQFNPLNEKEDTNHALEHQPWRSWNELKGKFNCPDSENKYISNVNDLLHSESFAAPKSCSAAKYKNTRSSLHLPSSNNRTPPPTRTPSFAGSSSKKRILMKPRLAHDGSQHRKPASHADDTYTINTEREEDLPGDVCQGHSRKKRWHATSQPIGGSSPDHAVSRIARTKTREASYGKHSRNLRDPSARRHRYGIDYEPRNTRGTQGRQSESSSERGRRTD